MSLHVPQPVRLECHDPRRVYARDLCRDCESTIGIFRKPRIFRSAALAPHHPCVDFAPPTARRSLARSGRRPLRKVTSAQTAREMSLGLRPLGQLRVRDYVTGRERPAPFGSSASPDLSISEVARSSPGTAMSCGRPNTSLSLCCRQAAVMFLRMNEKRFSPATTQGGVWQRLSFGCPGALPVFASQTPTLSPASLRGSVDCSIRGGSQLPP